MYKIATLVAYAFYVYYFKNVTIVAYAGLRVDDSDQVAMDKDKKYLEL